jgi:hypothetical protein
VQPQRSNELVRMRQGAPGLPSPFASQQESRSPFATKKAQQHNHESMMMKKPPQPASKRLRSGTPAIVLRTVNDESKRPIPLFLFLHCFLPTSVFTGSKLTLPAACPPSPVAVRLTTALSLQQCSFLFAAPTTGPFADRKRAPRRGRPGTACVHHCLSVPRALHFHTLD